MESGIGVFWRVIYLISNYSLYVFDDGLLPYYKNLKNCIGKRNEVDDIDMKPL
jgi:hypothetical protein